MLHLIHELIKGDMPSVHYPRLHSLVDGILHLYYCVSDLCSLGWI
jgi:hypothetical protein